MDPVVAAKVNFTNNTKDLEEFIEPGRIPRELGGKEDWEYKYVEPLEGENNKMKDTETRDKLLEGRDKLVHEFEGATLRWIITGGTSEGDAVKQERNELARRLREDYWNLDPYVRARSVYDRTGVLQSQNGGKVDFYEPVVPANGDAKTNTLADDVD